MLSFVLILLPTLAFANLKTAMMSDDYPQLFSLLELKLKASSRDVSALFIKTLYSYALDSPQAGKYEQQLQALSPTCGQCLRTLTAAVREEQMLSPVIQASERSLILALGSPVDLQGRPLPRLKKTLEKTLALAKQYPQMPVLVTGAAVANQWTEAFAMKRWLVAQGLNAHRIITESHARNTLENARYSMRILPKSTKRIYLITVNEHVKRASLIFDAVMKNKGITVSPVAAGFHLTGRALKKQQAIEYIASYRDSARAMGVLELSASAEANIRCSGLENKIN